MENKNKVPYGFVYETINNINGMKYIGKCIYGRINNWQSYLGSGTYLKRAISKYGKENFKKKILQDAFSDEELNSLEEKYIIEKNDLSRRKSSKLFTPQSDGSCSETRGWNDLF